jgi:hypothetical protein
MSEIAVTLNASQMLSENLSNGCDGTSSLHRERIVVISSGSMPT